MFDSKDTFPTSFSMRALAVALACLPFSAAAAGIPAATPLAYSGTLTDSGQPVNGNRFIIIKVWKSQGGNDQACITVPGEPSTVTGGRFSVPLDDTCTAAVHASSELWVEPLVDGVSMGRSKLRAVPYAVEADTASNATGNLATQISELVPPGTVVAYAGPVTATAPAGWMFCDGAAISRAQYARLFAVIGTAHGNGDGATTFHLPDYRGRFLRGVDGGATRDPDASSRQAMNPNGNTGNNVGTVQAEALKAHNHGGKTGPDSPDHSHRTTVSVFNNHDLSVKNQAANLNGGNNHGTAVSDSGGASARHTHAIPSDGGSETRPTNAAVNYLIRL